MQPRQRLRCHAGCLVPRGQGKIEFGLDLVGGTDVDRTDRDQRLRDQRQPAGRSPSQDAGLGRAAQFGLGQLPQVGFRTSAVHVSSVLPQARTAAGSQLRKLVLTVCPPRSGGFASGDVPWTFEGLGRAAG